MYFNEMELKVYYEMKKEEMEKAVLASRYSKNSPASKLYRNFLNMFKKNQKAVPKSDCCEIKIQEVCCGN
ncbi:MULTISPECIES: hypothetical protein [Neobacillus]|uniref:Uncharacterized protein n=1 Tax=Neobacillus citreus TaxID=2833578 RepID=A0A942SX13_9BACI|nr:hypothetical protein [Neobacillus citreus]MCH6265890.1 hypothetical protein [Neobacillus citreus]